MVKVCKYNEYHDVMIDYLVNRGVKVESAECLGRCDLCHTGAFIQYNLEFIAAENAKLLILKLETLNML